MALFNWRTKPTLADDLFKELEQQMRVTIDRNLDRIEAEGRAHTAQMKLAYLQSIDLSDSHTFNTRGN